MLGTPALISKDIQDVWRRTAAPLVWAKAALFCVLCALAGGCATQKITCNPADYTGCVVDEIDIIGNEALADDDITSKIATAETGGVLEAVPIAGAIDKLTVQYERFDRFVLERDLLRVARLYRAKGYYEAVVRAGRVRRLDKHEGEDVRTARLLVEIIVEEGPPVRVVDADRDVTIGWVDRVPTAGDDADAAAAAQDAKNQIASGDIFTEEQYEKVRAGIQRALTDRGFGYATVVPSADVNLMTHAAKVGYAITLGPRCTFGDIELLGLGGLPEWQIRPALGLEKGDVYSTAKLSDAERVLAEFGVFGSIAIEPQLSKAEPLATEVPIKIRLQPATLGAVRLGGGIEVGDQVAAHALAGWQHKNAAGALDRFSVEARPRLVLYPWRLGTLFGEELTTGEPVVFLVPEIVLRLQYALPMPFDPPTSLFVQSSGSIALERNTDPPPYLTETSDIQGEYLLEHRQGIQRKFWQSHILLSLSHNLSFSFPFSYNLDDDQTPEEESLLFSYLQLFWQLDLRKDIDGKWNSVRPASGIYTSIDLQLAGYFLRGDADDVKIRPEFRWYAPLGKRLVLAGRLAFALLYPEYGFVLDEPIEVFPLLAPTDDGSVSDEILEARRQRAAANRKAINRDVQILEKRGLFSGGPGSNRGYGSNEIAPHRVIDDNGNRLPAVDAIGGRTAWEISVELRFPIVGDLGGTAFIDASDVTAGFAQLRADHPHLSTGIGLAYFTPVGPLRIDLGVRVPYLQKGGEDIRESCNRSNDDPLGSCTEYISDQGDPDNLFGLPMALSIAIGNAY
jgi:outer membrane translocation and assembly module TamA